MNSYQRSLESLLNSGPPISLGLERMQGMLQQLGYPERQFPIFHVAGTNGKGSTCVFIESILRTAGFSVGQYTSPHLTCARERIQINRELISEDDFALLEALVPQKGTFFERMTAMAFLHFANAKVDFAVIEVGLGGRLDATNTVRPLVCGISKIDLDHQQILGESVQQIAYEKAGIMKPCVPVIWSEQAAEVTEILNARANEIGALVKNRAPVSPGDLGLKGEHQMANASLAVAMIKAAGLTLEEPVIRQGLTSARWPCRYEVLPNGLILDGAHNPSGTRALIATLQADGVAPEFLSVGLTEGHNGEEIASLWHHAFPLAKIFAGQSTSLRAVPAQQVASCFEQAGFANVQVSDQFEYEKGHGVVTGSLYWTGLVRSKMLSMPIDNISMMY
ncbi:MAG: folylpolyglutamate synthase/dihydrofolate synthase family protein [Myxococcota bacterium]